MFRTDPDRSDQPTAPFPEDIQAQTTRVLENIRAILEDQALGFADVVKATVFMTNLGDFARMNEVYSRFFTSDFPPVPPSKWRLCLGALPSRSR